MNWGKRRSRTEGLGDIKKSFWGFWGMGIRGLGFGVRTEELEEPSFSARALAACTAHPSASEHVHNPLQRLPFFLFEVCQRFGLVGHSLAPQYKSAPPKARLNRSGGRGTASTDGWYWLSMVMTALPSPHGAIEITPGMLWNLDHERERSRE